MKFWEAMKAIEEGKKVYCPDWEGLVEWHLELRQGEPIIIADNGREGIDFSTYLYLCMGKEWELKDMPGVPGTYDDMSGLPTSLEDSGGLSGT